MSRSERSVVIVGGGLAGLPLARALGRKRVRVTLVDANNYHMFVPLLYQVASAALGPEDISAPIRHLVRHYSSVTTICARVTGVDTAKQLVLLANQEPLPFRALILATGAQTSYPDVNWQDVAPGLHSIGEAKRIRDRLLVSLEEAEQAADPAIRDRLSTTVIVGGGSTGVEMAGALAELVHVSMRGDFRRIDPRNARIILVEQKNRLLREYPETLSSYAHRALQKLGVEVLLDHTVKKIDASGIVVNDTHIPAANIVWAAKTLASPAASWLPAQSDEIGRLIVEADLSVPGIAGIFAIGDTAHCKGIDDQALPPLGQVAAQQAKHLGKHLPDWLEDKGTIPAFAFQDRGKAAIVGRNAAVCDFGRTRLRGRLAWLLWASLHVYLLADRQKRFLVATQWGLRYLTRDYNARIIEEPYRPRESSKSV